jgi:hypothetical protein
MKADTGGKVGLGCGTLILIALIVSVFGNMAADDLRQEVRQMNTQVERLELVINDQVEEIQALRVTIEGLRSEMGREQ